MAKQIDVAQDLLKLHKRYIVEDGKPKYDFILSIPSSNRPLNHDEIYEFISAVSAAPRIGRVFPKGRKARDEIVAIPRGLLEYIVSEWNSAEGLSRMWQEEYKKERGQNSGVERCCETCRYDLGGSFNNCHQKLESESATGECEAWEAE